MPGTLTRDRQHSSRPRRLLLGDSLHPLKAANRIHDGSLAISPSSQRAEASMLNRKLSGIHWDGEVWLDCGSAEHFLWAAMGTSVQSIL